MLEGLIFLLYKSWYFTKINFNVFIGSKMEYQVDIAWR